MKTPNKRLPCFATLLFINTVQPALGADTYTVEPPMPVEAGFPGKDAKVVGNMLAMLCDKLNMRMDERTEYQVTCVGKSEGVNFNRYSKERKVVRFAILDRDGVVVVRPTSRTETTTGLGQVSESGGGLKSRLIEVLDGAGANWPAGTVITGYDTGISGYTEGQGLVPKSWKVMGVAAGSAAAAAGLRVGDQIIKINGKRFADQYGLIKHLLLTPAGGQIQMEVKRADGVVVIPVEARIRMP